MFMLGADRRMIRDCHASVFCIKKQNIIDIIIKGVIININKAYMTYQINRQ
jgi:hypothetical protein